MPACKQGAIGIEDGLAKVDRTKCALRLLRKGVPNFNIRIV